MIIYPEGFMGRELVEEAVRRHGFRLHSILETSSATSIINLVREGLGATVQPYPLIRQVNDPTLRTISIEGGAPCRSLSIIYRSDRYLSQAAKAFMERIQNYFQPRR